MSPTSRHSPSAASPTPRNSRSAISNASDDGCPKRPQTEACHTGPPKFASSHSYPLFTVSTTLKSPPGRMRRKRG